MIQKLLKTFFILVLVIVILWGFSDSYSSHNIDNLVHVVAIGIDKSKNEQNNIKVSFQFVNTSESGGESSGGGESSTIVTSIDADSINAAINLMNSYIGKELNFSHCKVIVFSEDFARNGISTEICTFINNEEIRPSTNIVISTSEANKYLKNSNPNIEKLVTNYYDTFELTSNFTGVSSDITIGKFYNKLFSPYCGNTAILGRTFEKSSNSSSEESSSSEGQNSEQGSEENQSENSEGESSSNDSKSSGQSSNGNSNSNDTDSSSLDISGKRGTQNVGIAVFKEDKYVGQLSELESISHLLIDKNVSSFVMSIPMQDFPDNLLDLNVSPSHGTKISVDTSSDIPTIYVTVFCEAKILTVNDNSSYGNSKVLKKISSEAQKFMKAQIENYLNKTSREFDSDISCFGSHAMKNFKTMQDWENYDWTSKYKNAKFNVDVKFDVTSGMLYLGHDS